MDSITQFLTRVLSGAPSGGAENSISFLQGIAAVGVAYLGGILASLTPCVYPMIPITVSVVGGGERRSWHEIWLRGFSYVGGMAVTYSFLGVLAGLTGKVFGTMTNTPGWYLALSLIMTLASLIMLDLIPFDPLSWWEGLKRRYGRQERSSVHIAHKTESTLLGAFVLGASSGFIAAPCTTPVLTAILAYIAKTQSVGLGLSLMLAFSLGLGTLLLLVAGFTGALKNLPRSGSWLKTMKLASGLLLLAFGQYLMYRAGVLGGI